MSLHSPPFYRYSLFDQWDKDTFHLIKRLAQTQKYPQLLGIQSDKDLFLTTLIRSQKALHGWRDMLITVFDQIKNTGEIDTGSLNKKFPPESIKLDTPAWVTYEEDKIVNDFIDYLGTKIINYAGTDEEYGEFILRFSLGQLGHDWEQTIMLIWEILGNSQTLSVKELNQELKTFDYLNIFA